jgi:hypothetical protein
MIAGHLRFPVQLPRFFLTFPHHAHCQATIFGRILMSKPGINYYDIRKQCQGPLCYDFSDADKFLNSAAVKKALGVKEETEWQECNMLVNANFYGETQCSCCSCLLSQYVASRFLQRACVLSM